MADRPQILQDLIAAVKGGDIARARILAREILAAGIDHPLALNIRALDHEEAGRFEASLADLQRAHVLAPNDFATLNACGLCLGRLERLEEALECFEKTLAIRADFTPAWVNKAWA